MSPFISDVKIGRLIDFQLSGNTVTTFMIIEALLLHGQLIETKPWGAGITSGLKIPIKNKIIIKN